VSDVKAGGSANTNKSLVRAEVGSCDCNDEREGRRRGGGSAAVARAVFSRERVARRHETTGNLVDLRGSIL
jgi:hypothetical protein